MAVSEDSELLGWLVLNNWRDLMYNAWSERLSTCVSIFMFHMLQVERKDGISSGTWSKHTQNIDGSFPLRISAMLGLGLQQEGDLTFLLRSFILPLENQSVAVIATQTLGCL